MKVTDMDEFENDRLTPEEPPKKEETSDTYDLFRKNFSLFDDDGKDAPEEAEADVKNSGEI